MGHWIVWPIIAVASITVCLILWFRDVQRIMDERKSTVESAAGQFAACKERAARTKDDPESAAVLARSEKIYRQAVDIYDRTLKKPGIFLPAILMGFRPIP